MASSGSDSSDSDSDGPLPGVVVSDNEDDALPPQAGFTEEEFDVAVKVMTRLAESPPEVFEHPFMRPLRLQLNKVNEIAKRRLFDGGTAEEYHQKKAEKRLRQIWRARAVEFDRKHINSTRLRAERIAKLKQLTEQGGAATNMPLIPDGTIDTSDGTTTQLSITDVSGDDAAGTEAKTLDEVNAQVFDAALVNAATVDADDAAPGAAVRLLNHRSCYTCKKRYRDLHHFYDQLCPDCAELNFVKRHQKADMTGMVCLVTGGRVKIGYRIVLKLLRCGASVIATSRFPHDTARRYAAEPDADDWQDRLHVYGLDLRDIRGIEEFVDFISTKYKRLDVIVNNACQTVRRPAGFFKHLLGTERKPVAALPDAQRKMVERHHEFVAARDDMRRIAGASEEHKGPTVDVDDVDEANVDGPAFGLGHPSGAGAGAGSGSGAGAGAGEAGAGAAAGAGASNDGEHAAPALSTRTPTQAPVGMMPSSAAEASQVVMHPDDRGAANAALFPKGMTDVNEQQVDLRTHNSWLLKMHEVSTPELAEVFAINTLAPFILNSKLKPLMASTNPEGLKFIVNVSAMEGKFYRHKSPNHPHTNMAKAALNMMTRTSAADYAESNIYMTAVDTGWINDENPLERAATIATTNNFQTPLDEIDAAARVLDPVIQPLIDRQAAVSTAAATGEVSDVEAPPHGLFFKDFRETEW